MVTNDLSLFVTLWPSFPHFARFAYDNRIEGIRLNSAMLASSELDSELERVRSLGDIPVKLYFDVKGRQLRITEVKPSKKNLEVRLNHPISVKTPTPVLFKAGEDSGLLVDIRDNGYNLVFANGLRYGPRFQVKGGESLHIRSPDLVVGGNLFTETELEKIGKVKKAGFTRYFLSYVESENDLKEFRNLVGNETEVIAKIENKKGLEFMAREYKPNPNTSALAARGDLYVELERPHEIANALRNIIKKEPNAMVGSRFLLSLFRDHVPSCADIGDLAWVYDLGYKRVLLCDELCLKEKPLARAVSVVDEFRKDYCIKELVR